MPKRIITTNDESGRSLILIEEQIGDHAPIWAVSGAEPLGTDPGGSAYDLDFPEGVVGRYIAIPPDAVMAEFLKQGVPGLDEKGFHRTGTVDFLLLLEGKLTLELDDGKAELKPGDVVVQRDTNHAWRNPGPDNARCFVVIAKQPGMTHRTPRK